MFILKRWRWQHPRKSHTQAEAVTKGEEKPSLRIVMEVGIWTEKVSQGWGPWNCWHSVDTDGDAGSTLVWHVDTVKLIGSQELVVPLEELGYNRGTARWLLATGTQWERGDTGESSRWNLLGKVVSGPGKIAQWVKVLDTKPNNLSSIPWTLMVEKENQLCHLTSTYPLWYTLPQHTYAH